MTNNNETQTFYFNDMAEVAAENMADLTERLTEARIILVGMADKAVDNYGKRLTAKAQALAEALAYLRTPGHKNMRAFMAWALAQADKARDDGDNARREGFMLAADYTRGY